MSGIYIHIPFCKQACSYCDFYFVTRKKLIPAFLDTLIHEVRLAGKKHKSDPESRPLQTIYLGGGTPSRLTSGQLYRLVQAFHEYFDLSRLREFTIEVNPEDLSPKWLANVKQLGVTRLSMGIQTFQPDLLHFMNRAHSSGQAEHALELVADAGFDSFSVDLIYGNPGQTRNQIIDDINRLMVFEPPHVSAYSLTIEPKTRLGKQYQLGRLQPMDDDEVADQARLIKDTLAEYEILQYEVSNYARFGHKAVHNSAYWSHENYLGFGPAAHSMTWSADGKTATRRHHPPDLHQYEDHIRSNNPEAGSQETLTLNTLAEERIMMGLRTTDGVSLDELLNRYSYKLSDRQKNRLATFQEEGLMEESDSLRLTDKGMAIADTITLQLLR